MAAMRDRFCVIATLVVIQLVGCGQTSVTPTSKALPSHEAATAAGLLEGQWRIVKAVINGETFPQSGEDDIHVGGVYEFQSGTLTKRPNPSFTRFEVPVTRHSYSLSSALDPPQIDVKEILESAPAPPLEKLVYRLEGNQLTLCWSLDMESPRPTTFETRNGDNKGLYVLERAIH